MKNAVELVMEVTAVKEVNRPANTGKDGREWPAQHFLEVECVAVGITRVEKFDLPHGFHGKIKSGDEIEMIGKIKQIGGKDGKFHYEPVFTSYRLLQAGKPVAAVAV